jgi:hypothetical protein
LSESSQAATGLVRFKVLYNDGDEDELNDDEFKLAREHFEARTSIPPALAAALLVPSSPPAASPQAATSTAASPQVASPPGNTADAPNHDPAAADTSVPIVPLIAAPTINAEQLPTVVSPALNFDATHRASPTATPVTATMAAGEPATEQPPISPTDLAASLLTTDAAANSTPTSESPDPAVYFDPRSMLLGDVKWLLRRVAGGEVKSQCTRIFEEGAFGFHLSALIGSGATYYDDDDTNKWLMNEGLRIDTTPMEQESPVSPTTLVVYSGPSLSTGQTVTQANNLGLCFTSPFIGSQSFEQMMDEAGKSNKFRAIELDNKGAWMFVKTGSTPIKLLNWDFAFDVEGLPNYRGDPTLTLGLAEVAQNRAGFNADSIMRGHIYHCANQFDGDSAFALVHAVVQEDGNRFVGAGRMFVTILSKTKKLPNGEGFSTTLLL